jgi:sensor histidine kinase YesM
MLPFILSTPKYSYRFLCCQVFIPPLCFSLLFHPCYMPSLSHCHFIILMKYGKKYYHKASHLFIFSSLLLCLLMLGPNILCSSIFKYPVFLYSPSRFQWLVFIWKSTKIYYFFTNYSVVAWNLVILLETGIPLLNLFASKVSCNCHSVMLKTLNSGYSWWPNMAFIMQPPF